jgi:hypothetical protein
MTAVGDALQAGVRSSARAQFSADVGDLVDGPDLQWSVERMTRLELATSTSGRVSRSWRGLPLMERMTRLELATSTSGRVSRSWRGLPLMERMTRLELATSTLGRSRSTN